MSEWWNEEVGRVVDEREDTEHIEWLRNGQPKLQRERRTGDGESDWGMISRVTKRCFGKR